MEFSPEAQTGPIAVYGATGYTGRLVARELDRSGFEFRLAGRNQTKLAAVAAELESDPETFTVAVEDGPGLESLMADCPVVIACAGPFSLYGEPVLRAAVETGTHYLDTTGEQPFIQLAYERYGGAAMDNGSAVIPAMGFDYVPGDMIAALTAKGMGHLETIRLAYTTSFQPTRGTMLSALEMIKGGDLEWRDGGLNPAPQKISRGEFDFGPPIGNLVMTRYPAGEHLTVPRHIDTERVETALSAESLLPPKLAPAMPLFARPAGLLMRTPARKAVGSLVERLPEGATPEAREAATFTIACEAVSRDLTRRGLISGHDVYGITAAFITKGAILAATGQVEGIGGLAPSQAFDPESFLDDFERFSLTWSVTGR